MMTLVRAVVPALVVMTAALVAALPLGGGQSFRLVLPLMPAVVVLVWNSRRRDAVPEWIAFLAGLVLDALSQGPLGLWALMYLLAYVLASVLYPHVEDGALLRWARFALGVVLLALGVWMASSLYLLQLGETRALAIAAGLSVLGYPVFALLVAVIDPPCTSTGNGNLVRGG